MARLQVMLMTRTMMITPAHPMRIARLASSPAQKARVDVAVAVVVAAAGADAMRAQRPEWPHRPTGVRHPRSMDNLRASIPRRCARPMPHQTVTSTGPMTLIILADPARKAAHPAKAAASAVGVVAAAAAASAAVRVARLPAVAEQVLVGRRPSASRARHRVAIVLLQAGAAEVEAVGSRGLPLRLRHPARPSPRQRLSQ